MKGPSLDAIRKFKEQQERKKREDETKKIEDKINTLQHRAAQGDRKAKVLIKKIEEESKRAQNSNTEPSGRNHSHNHGHTHTHTQNRGQNHSRNHGQNRPAPSIKKPNSGLTDFDELMRLAATNTNEIKKQKPKEEVPRVKKIIKVATTAKVPQTQAQQQQQPQPRPKPQPPPQRPSQQPPQSRLPVQQPQRPMPSTSRVIRMAPPRIRYEEVDYEDEYESDGFVVDDDEDEARAELNKTLKDVFRYDRRRADRLEQEVDRHYQAIGRVSTFDDLEREERRATRLAQVEDAIELRKEEARKREKKLRLQGRR